MVPERYGSHRSGEIPRHGTYMEVKHAEGYYRPETTESRPSPSDDGKKFLTKPSASTVLKGRKVRATRRALNVSLSSARSVVG